MPSWNEIRDYARQKYALAQEADSWFSVVFSYEDNRSQLIVVRLFSAYDREWIEFRSAVCREEDLEEREALTRNMDLPVGALGLSEGMYYMTHAVCLEQLQHEEFDLPLQIIARTADELEEQYSPAEEDLY